MTIGLYPSYTLAMVILLRDSRPYDCIIESLLVPLEVKVETYRHSIDLQFNVVFNRRTVSLGSH